MTRGLACGYLRSLDGEGTPVFASFRYQTMTAGAKIGHRAPRERRFVAVKKESTAGDWFRRSCLDREPCGTPEGCSRWSYTVGELIEARDERKLLRFQKQIASYELTMTPPHLSHRRSRVGSWGSIR